VKPELECFDAGHTAGIWPLLDMGLLKEPLQFSFITNVLGGIPPMIESLQLQTKIMPKGSEWEVIGISKSGWRMIGSALVLGGNIRAGLEDNLYLPNGEMARSNGDLIEVAARMARDVGRKVATVDEAKKILRLAEYAPTPEVPKPQPTAQA
jgi:3-keto-5-aminohexanoate cleavage enzyme